MTTTQAIGDGASGRSLLGGRYQVLRALGRGGFGETFLAKDLQMPSARECVIKQLKPLTSDAATYNLIRDRFAREAEVLEKLGERSPQIPRLYAYFTEGGEFYLVQEWVNGDTLTQRLNREGRWSPTAVDNLLRQLLPVLETVHSCGIIHRDLKPDNIIVRHQDQRPFLIDFGAVKETMGAQINTQGSPVSSIVVGTPGFMPPEQAAGRPGYASDLYSLGWTAIYLLTGCFPEEFPADPHTGDLIWSDTLKTLPPNLRACLEGSTHSYPRSRFGSANDMLTTLIGRSPAPQPNPIPASARPIAPPPLPPSSAAAYPEAQGKSQAKTVALGRPAPPPTEAIAPPQNQRPNQNQAPVPHQRPSDDGGKGAGKFGQWSGILVGFAAVGVLVGGGLALSQWIKSLSPYVEAQADGRLITPDAYFLADAAYKSENRDLALQRVQELRSRGFDQAGWLWYPDYANLGDREIYQVFAGAFKKREDCLNLLKEYGRDRGDAYCGRASTNPQVQVDRVMASSVLPQPSQPPETTDEDTSDTVQDSDFEDNGIIDVPEIPFPDFNLPEFDLSKMFQDWLRDNTIGRLSPSPAPTSSPTSSPSAAPNNATQSNASAAEAGLRQYYSVLNQGNFREGWNRLTPEFQRNFSENSFDSYTGWWTQVQRTDVNSITVLESSADAAVVRAQLVYSLRNGRRSSETSTFRLVRQGDRWLFADVVQ
ncbi:MAG: protein kinase [Cyanophyceae cyanobacterium]